MACELLDAPRLRSLPLVEGKMHQLPKTAGAISINHLEKGSTITLKVVLRDFLAALTDPDSSTVGGVGPGVAVSERFLFEALEGGLSTITPSESSRVIRGLTVGGADEVPLCDG